MNKTTEMWKDYRKDQQERRSNRLSKRTNEILSLKGHIVKQLTPYQFRIDGKVDVYPTHNRYHILATGKRGDYRKIKELYETS